MVTSRTSNPTLGFATSIWRRTNDHNVFGVAAELAYFFMLALFPMLIFLTSLVSSLSGARRSIYGALSQGMHPDAMGRVSVELDDAISKRSGGLISIGIVGTLWAASAGVSALTSTLNRVFDVKETRSYWKVKGMAVVLTLSLSLLVVIGVLLVMFGDHFGEWAAERLHLGSFLAVGLTVMDYVVGFGLLLAGLEVTYYFGPNKKRQWRWVTPGAFAAVAAVLIVSILFSIYLRFGPSYSATYGSLGAFVMLMVWLYLMSLVIVLGAEIDSQREQT